MERSAKTVAAQVRFVDVPGGTSSAQGIAKLREVDALAWWSGASVPTQEPATELAGVRADLLLADLARDRVRAARRRRSARRAA